MRPCWFCHAIMWPAHACQLCSLFARALTGLPAVPFGRFLLASVLVVQTLAYSVLWNAQFFMRNTAVAGSLLLVYAETAMENKNMYVGLRCAAPCICCCADSSYRRAGAPGTRNTARSGTWAGRLATRTQRR